MTAGDFDLSHSGDEFLSVAVNGGQMQMYALQGATVIQTFTYGSQGNVSFPSVASGDFDGDFADEIIAFCSTDGSFKIYKLKNGLITHDLNDEEYFPLDQLNGVMCSARFSTDGTKDALVTQRSFDGQITIFNMEGLCPGLNLSNQTLNENTSTNNVHHANTDNNFTLDYHVNNTLTAGNNFNIDPPSIVTFTAGNEIILLPGFVAHAGCDFLAHIDLGIACSNPTFRLGNSEPEIEPTPTQIERPSKESIGLTVTPNPAAQEFTYKLATVGTEVRTYHVVLIDVYGKVIFSDDTQATDGRIDLANYSVGMYLLHISCDDGKFWDQRVLIAR